MNGQSLTGTAGHGLKGRLPFRLGTTSYIVPAGVVENVAQLANRVDDIELVFFEADGKANLPGAKDIRQLADIAADNALSYTVHFPLGIRLGSADEKQRGRSVQECLQLRDLTATLQPLAFVTHFQPAETEDVSRCVAGFEKSAAELLAEGIEPGRLCIETLMYPYEIVEGVVFRHNLAVCLDVGHVLLCGYPFKIYLERYFARTKVVHLHGITGGKDHCDISFLDEDVLQALFAGFRSGDTRDRVVTIEVFNEADFETSMLEMGRIFG